LVTLTFTISEAATAGDYALTLSYNKNSGIIDNDLAPVDVAIVNGIINVR
jgi:hypothetical protein